jgi:hypothetical protein
MDPHGHALGPSGETLGVRRLKMAFVDKARRLKHDVSRVALRFVII